jgi:hypothetical protein
VFVTLLPCPGHQWPCERFRRAVTHGNDAITIDHAMRTDDVGTITTREREFQVDKNAAGKSYVVR